MINGRIKEGWGVEGWPERQNFSDVKRGVSQSCDGSFGTPNRFLRFFDFKESKHIKNVT